MGAVAAAAFALGGCGTSDTDAKTPVAAAPPPGAGANAEPTAEKAADPAKVGFDDEGYACGLLTRADVETLFGGPVGDAEPSSVGASRFCQWKTVAGDPWVFLQVGTPSNGADTEYAQLRKAFKEAKDIPGLGRKAYSYYHRGETHVYVRVDDKLVKVAVQYIKDRAVTPEADVARVTTLARQVVGRM
ncbi:hypothetical protein KRMM14A1004_00860 [Krasilnikovia sp. MM14-A1004]